MDQDVIEYLSGTAKRCLLILMAVVFVAGTLLGNYIVDRVISSKFTQEPVPTKE